MHGIPPALQRFLRYVLVGGSTFGFDLILLYVVTTYLSVPYYLATPGAFLVAVSINYLVSRHHVFRGTERSLHTGYAYFITFALIGAGITTLGVTVLVTYLGLYFLYARVLVALLVGTLNYFSNLFFNFKVVGIHS